MDLPSQKQLLAQYRCDEIERKVYDQFISVLKDTRQKIESGQVIQKVGDLFSQNFLKTVQVFDQNASRYHQGVYLSKRQDLLNKLDTNLHAIFVQQIRNLHRKYVQEFLEALKVSRLLDSFNIELTV